LHEISESSAKQHTEKWINAWNDHDLKTILSMYSDNVEFSSPKIKLVFPERKLSKITNKKDLQEYWTKALSIFPNLRFIPKQTMAIADVCLFEYDAVLDGKNKTHVLEKFQFQDDGLVKKSMAFYGSEEPI
jgi:ketosteroid isomerase-like protein